MQLFTLNEKSIAPDLGSAMHFVHRHTSPSELETGQVVSSALAAVSVHNQLHLLVMKGIFPSFHWQHEHG